VERSEILAQVQAVVRDVLHRPDLVLADEMTFEEAADWDSIAQVQMIVAIESRLDIRFGLHELATLSSVAALIDAIARKLDRGTPCSP
jgi:acyl carrier protein